MNTAACLDRDFERVTVQLGLGANLGDRGRALRMALFALAAHPEIELVAVSSVYETEYVGEGEQDAYLNACASIETALPPLVLLAVLKSIETRLGRQPNTHMQPRPIDLDILLYGDLILSGPSLIIPHAEVRRRAFVLAPLAEIAGDVHFPDSQETVTAAYAKMANCEGPRVCPGPTDLQLPDPTGAGEDDWFAALALHCR